jgi:hypothetical protein
MWKDFEPLGIRLTQPTIWDLECLISMHEHWEAEKVFFVNVS